MTKYYVRPNAPLKSLYRFKNKKSKSYRRVNQRYFGEKRTGSRTYMSHLYNNSLIHHAIRRKDIISELEDKNKNNIGPNKQRYQNNNRNIKEYEDKDSVRRD